MIGSRFYWLLLLLNLYFLVACTKEEPPIVPKTSFSYIHTGHTRGGMEDNQLFPAAAAVDYSSYDMRWLGGDLSYFSTKDIAQLTYLDNIFDLANPQTLLSPGNHEYADHPELLAPLTGRNLFYTHHQNGITFLVFDTQGDDNKIEDEQLQLFKSVTDTLSQSSHLIILHHHLIWLMDGGALEEMANSISNGATGTCSHCLKENNFYKDLYPVLVNVENQGIEVICIGGDIGNKVQSYEMLTAEGVTFLASGLSKDILPMDNKVLIFEHKPTRGSLQWRYELLSNLPLK